MDKNTIGKIQEVLKNKQIYMQEKTMMLITSKYEGAPTFRAISISHDCPYNEMIYNPFEKVMGIVTKVTMNVPNVIPKINDDGDFIQHRKKPNEYARVQKIMDVPYEYNVSDTAEMEMLLDMFCINEQAFDWKKYLGQSVEKPSAFSAKIEE